MQKAGLGELFEKYIDLKNKLEQAGLFNEATKKLLPRFPRVIGVITSSDGAALRDVLSTLLRPIKYDLLSLSQLLNIRIWMKNPISFNNFKLQLN